MDFTWDGDLDDDCVCRSVPGYLLHAEAMDDRAWYCSVQRTDGATVFHSSEADILPLTGAAARKLAEMAVRADLVEAVRLRAALQQAEWLVEELRGQRDAWRAMVDRPTGGEF